MWKIESYNASNLTLKEGGDFPVEPGGLISALIVETEEEARRWLETWNNKRSINSTEIRVYSDDVLVETYMRKGVLG